MLAWSFLHSRVSQAHVFHITGTIPSSMPCLMLTEPLDSPAASNDDVSGRPRLPAADAPEASALIKDWIKWCRENHPDCRNLIDGSEAADHEEPLLPSRMLYLDGEVGAIRPRLVCTGRDLRGRYTALSHRWGDVQPLTTQTATIEERKAGIPWQLLPKTFQDAATATKSIGVDYLWIDSLCIVQDDHDD